MNNLNQKGNKGRKQRADARRQEMLKLEAKGRTNEQIGNEVGVAVQTVKNNLSIARKEGLTVTEQDREELVDELLRIKADVEAHRKSDGKMPLTGVDRLIKIAEVIARIKLPTRSESVNIHADAQNIGPYRKFVLACSGLDEQQVERLLQMAREMPRKPFVMTQPPDTSPLWNKQLTEGNDETS